MAGVVHKLFLSKTGSIHFIHYTRLFRYYAIKSPMALAKTAPSAGLRRMAGETGQSDTFDNTCGPDRPE